jgi:two-component system, sensor histidine kinase and response regulator
MEAPFRPTPYPDAGPLTAPSVPARILVVDDEETTRLYVSGLLEKEGYAVSTAACGADALAAAAERPDLILLDVMLPDADGFTLCRELRAEAATRDIPVIFLTAKGDEPEIVRGFESGGVDYIVKPFAVAVLLARVGTHATLSQLSRGLCSALDDRTERLQQANLRLRELNVEMATLDERQRRQLAQQLHDTTIQQLVLTRILLEGEVELAQRRDQLVDLVAGSIRQLRSLVFELSPPLLRSGGLYPALEWLAGEVREQWGLEVICEREGALPPLADALVVTLFQGARELLINAAKHAEAQRATLSVRCDGTVLTLCIADDGRGFDPDWLARQGSGGGIACAAPPPRSPAGGGFGLYSLRSRIELLGGCLTLRNGRARGAEVGLSIRVDAAGERSG